MPTSVMWWNSPTSGIGFAPGVGAGGVLGMPRTDGYADGTDSIQGVRTYDSNAGTWTTPDVYAGTVDDPASQKSYMWNGNNPVGYSDASGFCADPGGTGARVCIDAFIQQASVMGGMVGDNRGFERNTSRDSFRVQVDISFGKEDGHVVLGTSHLSVGGIVLSFRATNNGSTVQVHGNVALVHIDAVVGGPLGLGGHAPPVVADLVVVLNKDGSVSIFGLHTQFPSWEAYCYGCKDPGSGWRYAETPRSAFGPLYLAFGENTGVFYVLGEESEEQQNVNQKESEHYSPNSKKQ